MAGNGNRRPMPLEGVRGLVMTQAWAGTFATELLGLLGAEIIQVEARQPMDLWRGRPEVWKVPVPEGLRDRPNAKHGWNTNPSFNSVNLNKKGVTIDLTRSKGVEIFMQLLKYADFFAENYSPRVMRNFGLEYDAMKVVKPNIIVLNLSTYGRSGVHWNVGGFGSTAEPMAGLTELLGYEDGPPLGSGAVYCDPVAGYQAAAALLVALHHRDRTGQGQRIDVSMQETGAIFISDALMEYSINRTVRRRLGNHHLTLSPHNIYPCRDEQWLALAVRDEDDWQRFCEAVGHSEWTTDERFETMAARKRNEAALDDLISAWTRGQAAQALEDRLSVVLPAAKVRSAGELGTVEHLRARGFLVELDHPETGTLEYVGVPFQLTVSPAQARMPAPTHGQHSWEVLSHYLGMSREEYDQLVEAAITGEGPPP